MEIKHSKNIESSVERSKNSPVLIVKDPVDGATVYQNPVIRLNVLKNMSLFEYEVATDIKFNNKVWQRRTTNKEVPVCVPGFIGVLKGENKLPKGGAKFYVRVKGFDGKEWTEWANPVVIYTHSTVETTFGPFVIGQTGDPLVLETGPDICTNKFADITYVPYVFYETGSFGRKEIKNPFGDYVLYARGNETAQLPSIRYTIESAAGTFGYVISCWLRTTLDTTPYHGEILFVGEGGGYIKNIEFLWPSDRWMMASIYIPEETWTGGSYRYVYFYPSTFSYPTPQEYYIVNISVKRVLNAWTFNLPNGWREQASAQCKSNYMVGFHNTISERKRFKHQWVLSYPYLSRMEMSYFNRIQVAKRLMFYPHSNNMYVYDVRVNDTSSIDLFQGKRLGYRPTLELLSGEVFERMQWSQDGVII